MVTSLSRLSTNKLIFTKTLVPLHLYFAAFVPLKPCESVFASELTLLLALISVASAVPPLSLLAKYYTSRIFARYGSLITLPLLKTNKAEEKMMQMMQ